MQEILTPSPKAEKVRIVDPVRVPEPEQEKKKNLFKRMFTRKKKKQESPEPQEPVVRYIDKTSPSIIEGLKDSTSSVKASYLAPVTVEVTELYLRDHASPQKMSFKALYKGLTGVETADFFQRKFKELQTI